MPSEFTKDWVYRCVVTDINVHRNQVMYHCDNPQSPWQADGLSTKQVNLGAPLRVGDRVDLVYHSNHYSSGAYYIDEVYPTDNPGTPTYEIVDQGRWYDKYLCCSKADQADVFCVCTVRIACPVHTNGKPRCIGSHD